MRGYDVVGGKLVATSLNSFYGLIAIFPVLAIPLLMGGITNGEFWRMAAVLANTFLFSLSIGMFVSSISKYPRKAAAATILLLILFAIVLPLSGDMIRYVYRSPRLNLLFRTLSPETSFNLVMDADYRRAPQQFWRTFGAIHGLCWLLLGAASFIVPRSWQDNPPGAKVQRWRDLWHRWSYGDVGERARFRARLLDINAFFWLAGRARLKPVHVWVAIAGLACLWSWGAIEDGGEWLSAVIYFITAIILNTMLKIWVASEAGRRLGEDRKIGALELLLSTPLSVGDILRGQMLALKRQFFAPLIVVLGVEIIFLLASLRESRADADSVSFTIALGATTLVLLVADMFALSIVGMWASLTARNPNRSTGIAVRRILVLPWAVIIGLYISGILVSYAGRGRDPGWQFFMGLYFVSGIVTDLVFGFTAWRRLHTEFREIAVQRYSATPSFWSRLLRRSEPV